MCLFYGCFSILMVFFSFFPIWQMTGHDLHASECVYKNISLSFSRWSVGWIFELNYQVFQAAKLKKGLGKKSDVANVYCVLVCVWLW